MPGDGRSKAPVALHHMAGELDVLLLLGGNLDGPPALLARAEELLARRAGTSIARSRDHWTEPWGFTDAPLFLNRALIVRTHMDPMALLEECLAVERELGRVRGTGPGYTSRTVDIDILLCGTETLATEKLVVPHPRMHERAFALAPSADIAPSWRHPSLGRTVLQLLNDLRTAPPGSG